MIPPYRHRHDELVWELSALHTHWLNAYDPDGSLSAPLAWHRDFADARNRLREWYTNIPRREKLRRTERLGWSALACALDASLDPPDYTIDLRGWRPRGPRTTASRPTLC